MFMPKPARAKASLLLLGTCGGLCLLASGCGGNPAQSKDTALDPTAPTSSTDTQDTAPTTPTTGPTTGPTTPTTTTTTTTDSTVVERGALVLCSQPGLREAARFERRIAPGEAASSELLTHGGLVVGDLSGDGLHDIVLVNESGAPAFWRGRTDTYFDEVSSEAFGELDLEGNAAGVAVDYDADGDLDLFFVRWEQPHVLLQNDGTGHFEDVTSTAGDLGLSALKSQSTAWADMDLDGDLDLVVGSYGDTPGTFDDPDMLPAEPAELFENLGDGTFLDVSHRLPTEMHEGYQFQTAWVDIDRDSLPELISVHDFGKVRQSVLLKNQGGTFELDPHSGFHPGFEGMGLGVGDLNGDGHPDFLQSSWRAISLLQSSTLTIPGETSLVGTTWIEWAASIGLEPEIGIENFNCYGDVEPGIANQCYGWGSELLDVDNDTDLDAVMIFGYWASYDGTRIEQADGLWLQDDSGQFTDVAAEPEWGFADTGSGRGLSWGDFNHDGWIDLAKRELEGPSPLYLSNCGSDAWTRIELRDESANTFGVGARIEIQADDHVQVRWILAGGTSIYSANPLEAHFGLGDSESIDLLTVEWADGHVDTFTSLPGRRLLTLRRTR
jgi:hypothetical protein